MNIIIQNGLLMDPRHQINARQDLFLSAGKVAGVGRAPDGFCADRVVNAEGLVVCPGLIDLCARAAKLETELYAAVSGGVTTLVSPPDINPVLDEPELVERLVRRADDLGLSRMLPLGALTQGLLGERLSEMAGLKRAGCIAFSQGKRPVFDTYALLRAFEYASTFGFSVWLQPQDYYLSRNGFAHEGEISGRLGLTGIPVSAETIAISTCLTLAENTGIHLHLHRISSGEGIQMVAKAQSEGASVSCDIGIHHLHLSEHDIGFFDTLAHFCPPLRAKDDQDALRQYAAKGVAALCSDHTPLDQDAKLMPFGEALTGATGLELLLPLSLKWGREMGLSLLETLKPLTTIPAAILGQDDLGHLGVGAKADICLFSRDQSWGVSADTLYSAGKNTPFLGQSLFGKVKMTFVEGREVWKMPEPG